MDKTLGKLARAALEKLADERHRARGGRVESKFRHQSLQGVGAVPLAPATAHSELDLLIRGLLGE